MPKLPLKNKKSLYNAEGPYIEEILPSGRSFCNKNNYSFNKWPRPLGSLAYCLWTEKAMFAWNPTYGGWSCLTLGMLLIIWKEIIEYPLIAFYLNDLPTSKYFWEGITHQYKFLKLTIMIVFCVTICYPSLVKCTCMNTSNTCSFRSNIFNT